jgi:type I restriction enzyme S subunit
MNNYFLGDLLKIKNGRDHKHLEDGKIPVFGSGGLMRYVNQSLYDDESILLPRKGSLSNIQYTKKPFWTVDTLYYTEIDKKKVEPYYLYHYLKRLDLSNLNSGTGVPSMTFGAYYDIKIKLPDLPTQQKIASVLSALDDKIELNNRINAELEAMAKTLYDYWFVQFDFPIVTSSGVEKPYKTSGGKMVYNETLKREIPEGWEVKELKNIAEIIMGQSPKGKSYNTDGNGVLLINGAADYVGDYLNPRIFTSEPTRLSKKDDLIFCIRATIGKLTYSEKEYCLGRGVASVRSKTEVLREYIYFSLNQEIERFKKHASGSIIIGITKDDLTDYFVLLPDKESLNIFHKIVNPLHQKIRKNLKQNQELSALRDWLLPMLMNGQVKVG